MVEFYNSAKKIRQFDGNDLINLSKCLQGCAFDVGIKDPIEQSNLVRITEFIQRNYTDLSIEQISLAFEMALTGKLDLDQKDLEHYQQFSMLYISKILNSFKEKQHNEIKNYKMIPKQIQNIEETEQQYHDRNIAYCISAFEQFKKSGEFKDLDNLVFKYLWKRKVISFTTEQINKFQKQALKNWISELAKASISAGSVELPGIMIKIRDLQNEKLSESDKKVIAIKARYLAINEAFTNYIEMDVDLSELLID